MSVEVIQLPIAQSLDARRTSDVDALYRSHSDEVFRYLRALTGDDEESLDLAALTFQRAIEHLSGREDEIGIGWLIRTARNAAIDASRRRSARRRTVERLVPTSDEADAESQAIAGETQRELWAALAELSVPQREAIAIRYSTSLPIHDIAIVIGRTEAATQKLITRGLGRLKEILDERA